MTRENLNDLAAFIAVAREGSFTKAASKMGVSQSALSHTIRNLETKLGVRLLSRSTRSVSATEAGERLLVSIGPKIDEIETELSAIQELQGRPTGTIRISAGEHAVRYVLWPKISKVLSEYPDISIELTLDYKLVDIVAERYDMGVRLGESVPKDMIAVRISSDMSMAVVGTSQYFDKQGVPKIPSELTDHNCINLRLPTYGGVYAWEFEHDGQEININVTGQLTFNSSSEILTAALQGYGLAFVPADMVDEYVKSGALVRVLEDWCPPFPGYYLYYPNRRQSSSAFNTVIEALRHTN